VIVSCCRSNHTGLWPIHTVTSPVRIWLAPAVRTNCRDTLFAELWPTCSTRCMSAGSFGARQPAEGRPPLYPIAIGLPTLGYGNENPRCLGFCSKRLGYQPHHYRVHDVLDAAMIQLSSSHSPRSLDQWMRGFYCPYNRLGTSPQVMSSFAMISSKWLQSPLDAAS
jgi:hypothetical protein